MEIKTSEPHHPDTSDNATMSEHEQHLLIEGADADFMASDWIPFALDVLTSGAIFLFSWPPDCCRPEAKWNWKSC